MQFMQAKHLAKRAHLSGQTSVLFTNGLYKDFNNTNADFPAGLISEFTGILKKKYAADAK